MSNPEFVYTTYIMATPEQVWAGLTDPEFTKQYWGGTEIRSDWTVGSTVNLVDPARGVTTAGKVLVYDPPRQLAYSWNVLFHEVFSCEGESRVTFELTPAGGFTQLTITHDGFAPDSIVKDAISMGWPSVLAGLKTVLELGRMPCPIGDPSDGDPYEAGIAWGLAERAKRGQR
ncbi:MAG: hypothetical protein AMXMBFR84_44800 [Candidatus Hydrogenedentota bacterium]